jgi:hypothetical protein
MSTKNPKPFSKSRLRGPARDFAEYCELEKERRQNSGEAFDADTYDRAVDLVLRRLGAFQEEGGA